MIDLHRFLEMDSCKDCVSLLAGPKDFSRAVQELHYFDIQKGKSKIPEDSVVIIFGYEYPTWRLDAVLYSAAQSNAAAVAISSVVSLARPSAMLAERLSIPVLGINDFGTNIGSIVSEVSLLLASPALHRTVQVEKFVHLTSARNFSPQILLDEFYTATGLSAWLWTGRLPLPLTTKYLKDEEIPPASRVVGSGIAPVRIANRIGVQTTINVSHDLATIGVVSSGSGEVGHPELRLLLEVLALALRSSLAHELLLEEATARNTRDLFEDIMSVDAVSVTSAENRLIAAGFQPACWSAGFALVLDETTPIIPAAVQLMRSVELRGFQCLAVPRDGRIIGWISTLNPERDGNFPSIVAKFREIVSSLDNSDSVACGLGRWTRSLESLRDSIGEAQDIVSLAADRSGSSRFLTLDSLGINGMINSWTAGNGFQSAARIRLNPIAKSHDLLETLYVFLTNSMNVHATAMQLGIHRNTVATRISRIESELGTSLSNPDERLSLLLAAKALRKS
ncbi:PucR family transcriptional regulator [Brevibacterium ravenspurgense]|uniref:PucR family transcriptional regulator n=1 Tax=Brevibacterium ravenspurgense TaxID=479117 RepID=UPI000781F554|nr:helix-turn-helix domain-containing protein [Brevibacterium ravenspurgense]